MRYYFHAAAVYFLNKTVFDHFERYHLDIDIDIDKFHFRDRSLSSAIFHTIVEACVTTELKKTIVIQFGAWDIYHRGPRQTLRDFKHGLQQVLIDRLKDFFGGTLWCNG